MSFINKLFILFLILIFNSCGIISYREIPELFKEIVVGVNPIIVDENFFDNQPFSFINVKIGKNSAAILVLASINNGIYQWVGSNNEYIFTKNGKIIKTLGLPHDINIIEEIYSGENKLRLYTRFSNPEALVEITTEIIDMNKKLNLRWDNLECNLVKEKYRSNAIRFRGNNKYCYLDNNQVIWTRQKIHPYLDDLIIEFYYKY